MATIKSFTDLSQSKILANILPIQSADMGYICENFVDEDTGEIVEVQQVILTYIEHSIPCWSLAALLDVLPLEIETHKQTYEYKTYYYVELYMKCMGKEIYLSTEWHENLVDACVEMIIKLHEREIL